MVRYAKNIPILLSFVQANVDFLFRTTSFNLFIQFFIVVAIGYMLILCLRPLQKKQITHVLPLSSPPLFVFSARDRAVPARLAFFHDHGGQFCGVGWSAADARSGIPLP